MLRVNQVKYWFNMIPWGEKAMAKYYEKEKISDLPINDNH